MKELHRNRVSKSFQYFFIYSHYKIIAQQLFTAALLNIFLFFYDAIDSIWDVAIIDRFSVYVELPYSA